LLFVLAIAPAGAAPDAELWDRWLPSDPKSPITVDHYEWSRMLETYLVRGEDGVNRFDYAAVSAHDRATFLGYLDTLAQVPISECRRDEQLAYWINLYNALTVRVVLDHYPIDSILDIDISPGFFSNGPWQKKLFTVEGEAVSLDDIEHTILRPIWRDPRLHYALNCASIGCPELHAEAFTANNAERLLDESARAYINHPRGVEATPRGFKLSEIYSWYSDDFGADDEEILAHIRTFADPSLAAALDSGGEIAGYRYDWQLNDVR
jgi:hypothetical protein